MLQPLNRLLPAILFVCFSLPTQAQEKSYEQLITPEAISQNGLFKVHRVGSKLYFEIPKDLLEREMLVQVAFAAVPAPTQAQGGPYGNPTIEPVAKRVLRWSRRNNTIVLRAVNASVRSAESGPLALAVALMHTEPMLEAFPVEAQSSSGGAVIDVTRLFTTNCSTFTPPPDPQMPQPGLQGPVDPALSYIDTVQVFPMNIEVQSVLTASNGTFTVHYSMLLLPEQPMMPRLADERVAYYTTEVTLYGGQPNRVHRERHIQRFRLRQNKPIVFYISHEVPRQWRPQIKQGVEAWNSAFEKIGYPNAIVCRDAPSAAEDPTWSPDDLRHSVIRWVALEHADGSGKPVVDPRSGEILSSRVTLYHDVLKMLENWYFVQASPSDPRAQTLPLPVAVMGPLMRWLVSHEIGHALGLDHNHKASSAYTVAQLRDRKFTRERGLSPSIMDYARFNHVAQPGDGAALVPLIGPYDHFAIEYSYRPIPGAKTPEEERPVLERLLARQVSDPRLRYAVQRLPQEDPTVRIEDLGDDPIEATRWGLLNIKRVFGYLIPATTRPGGSDELLKETFEQVLLQWRIELEHVAALIGGIVRENYGDRMSFKPVPAARQRQALEFLLQHAFSDQSELFPDALRARLGVSLTEQLLATQERMIQLTLLEDHKTKLLARPEVPYGLQSFVQDLQSGLFNELASTDPTVSLQRRGLQRAYLKVMRGKTAGPKPAEHDLRAIGRAALKDLSVSITAALPKVQDPVSRAHFEDCLHEIRQSLGAP